MSRRSTNPRCELHVVEQLRYSPRSEHQVENTVKNYARRNRKTKFQSVEDRCVLIGCFCFVFL